MHGPAALPANMFDTVPGYEGTVAGEGGKKHASASNKTLQHEKMCLGNYCALKLCLKGHVYKLK